MKDTEKHFLFWLFMVPLHVLFWGFIAFSEYTWPMWMHPFLAVTFTVFIVIHGSILSALKDMEGE